MKKLFLVFLGSMLLVSSIMPAHVSAVSHVTNLRLQVQDSFGLPIADASAWLYVYVKGSPVLQHAGKTDSQGTIVAEYSPLVFSQGDGKKHADFALHIYHPSMGIQVKNWTAVSDAAPTIKVVVSGFSAGKSTQAVAAMGSGVFRTVLRDAMPTVRPVRIADMFHVPGVQVEARYESGVSTAIQTKMQVMWPAQGQWSVTGSLTRTLGTSTVNIWRSAAIPSNMDGMALLTEFNFSQELWELQEQDVDVYATWHTRQRWVEIKQTSHHGGAINGVAFATANNRKPFAEVVNGLHGSRIFIYPHTRLEQQVGSSTQFSNAVSFTPTIPIHWGIPTSFAAAATTTYFKRFTLSYDNSGNNFTVAIYDLRTNGSTWYVTRE